MSKSQTFIRKSVILGVVACAIFIVLLSIYGSRFLGQKSYFESALGNIDKERETVSRMRMNMLKSVELEKSAVMAITDEESKSYAEQSKKAADKVEENFHELKILVDKEGIDKEKMLISEFNECWKNFRKIDEELLKLAVENTNIKATNLSHTRGLETIKRFSKALTNLIEANSSNAHEVQIVRLAYKALDAVFMINSLQGPHINEPTDKKMDEMETSMKSHAMQAKRSLNAISALADKHGKSFLEEADAALRKFLELNTEIIRLSRLNSNVKSLELSLGNKRKVAAQCEDTLNSVQKFISDKTYKATR